MNDAPRTPSPSPSAAAAAARLPAATARRLARQLKDLGEPVRLRLLSIVVAAGGEGMCAGALAAAFDLTKPTVSHHLKVLGEAGLVTGERCGTQIIYRAGPTARRLHTILDGFARPDGQAAEPGDGGHGGLRRVLDELGVAEQPERPAEPRRTTADRPLPGLLDPEDLLDRVQERLTIRFSGMFSPETVQRYLRESYELLARSATVTPHLPTLTERFAAERLTAVARRDGIVARSLPEVLFVCVHNAGRSQMAAALLRHLAGDRVQIRSAGSAPAAGIDPMVEAIMSEVGIDLRTEFPKPLTDEIVHSADTVVTMGCGDACPVYPGTRYLDWPTPDPAGQGAAVVRGIRDDIDTRIRTELLPGLLSRPPDPDREAATRRRGGPPGSGKGFPR
ncbi:ArsR family transcriptional regulator [Nocardiopsis mwathae]|uniref:ArsR family transcriptional regulator n=1 Tax=Nocardiopsis mwathae TaxID=1472723 RepID=A0A7X0D6D4_9ACTN|nr:metalloregulator ArsR/SmtB family transcription factor [Nocardiopsis mwathae]MBB6172626.1 ArsR family transcriptional regulator [Nocardiopsis mwathae]